MPLWMGGQDGPSTMPPAGAGAPTGTTGYLQQMATQYGINLGATGGMPAAPTEPVTIYLGKGRDMNAAPAEVRRGIFDRPGYGGDKTGLRDMLLGDLISMKKEKQRELALWLVLGGYTGGPQFTPGNGTTVPLDKAGEYAADMSQAEVLNAYDSLLKDAANLYSIGQKVTPMQVLRKAIGFRLPGSVKWDGKLGSLNSALAKAGIDLNGSGSDALDGTFTQTSKSKSLDFMDPMDAKALARGVLQQELGRDPTQAEYEDFLSAIHAAEASNPNITKTTQTSTYDEGRLVDSSSSSVTHAGITGAGLAQVATDKAQSNPNWAEWQAMGTYAPALFAALGATVPGV